MVKNKIKSIINGFKGYVQEIYWKCSCGKPNIELNLLDNQEIIKCDKCEKKYKLTIQVNLEAMNYNE